MEMVSSFSLTRLDGSHHALYLYINPLIGTKLFTGGKNTFCREWVGRCNFRLIIWFEDQTQLIN